MNIKKMLKITLIVLVSIVVLFIVVHTVLTHILDDTLYGVTVGDSTRCGAYITEEHIFKDKLGGRYCTKCNYDSTVEGEISLRDPEKHN